MSGSFALVFGNTQYSDPALAQLLAPGKDAEELARVLKAPDLCQFDEVTVCLNQRSFAAIESIDAFFDGRKPDDLLLLYFSGHGIRDELGSLYLAFTNTIRTRLRSTALKADYIREAMDESRSKRQVLILDCCNSGAFPSGTKAELGGVMGMAAALQGYGRYVLTASDATQFAWEGDRIIGQTSNSLFTHFLVQGLEGDADRDSDGTISVDDLYDYAFEQIARVTPNQTPTKSASRQEGEIILRRITRLEDIKPVSLPDDLVEAIGDARTFVREGAVQQLAKLLVGKNLGLARSAREALEQLVADDDSLRVRGAATAALAPVLAAEQQEREQAEQERLKSEQAEAERLAAVKAQEQQAAQQEAEARRLAQQKRMEEQRARAQADADRLAQRKAQEEQQRRERAEAERIKQVQAQQKQAARQQAEAVQPGVQPQWIAALWITLGSSILAALPDLIWVHDSFSRILAGLAVAGVLYLQRVVKQWQSLLWIALGWAVGWGLDSAIISANHLSLRGGSPMTRVVTAALAGAIAGFAIVMALRREKVISRRDTLVWVTLAWTVAGAVDALVFAEIVRGVWGAGRYYEAYWLPDFIAAAAGAATGSLAMLWLIRKMSGQPEGLAAARAEGALTAGESLQQNLRPHWLSALAIALGGGIGGALLVSLHNLDYASPELVVNFAFWGLCIGLAAALVLRFQRTLAGWQSVVGIVVGWVVALALGAALALADWGQILSVLLVLALSWAVGGFAIGVALYAEHAIPSRAGIGWITLAWVIGGVAGALVIYLAVGAYTSNMPANTLTATFATAGAVGAAVGGLGMIWFIRKANGKNPGAWGRP